MPVAHDPDEQNGHDPALSWSADCCRAGTDDARSPLTVRIRIPGSAMMIILLSARTMVAVPMDAMTIVTSIKRSFMTTPVIFVQRAKCISRKYLLPNYHALMNT